MYKYWLFKNKKTAMDIQQSLNILERDGTEVKIVVVVVDQFWHFIAAYELFVLFFSSVLSSCTLSHVASLRMRRIFNFLDRSPLADSSSNGTICAEGIQPPRGDHSNCSQFPTQCSSLFFFFFFPTFTNK